jgi:hypothetical protein
MLLLAEHQHLDQNGGNFHLKKLGAGDGAKQLGIKTHGN